MSYRCLGMNLAKSTCGSIRRRSSAQFRVVRIEFLEDRFLLTGGSADGLSDLQGRPGLSLPAETASSSQAPAPVSSTIQQVNESTVGATDDSGQSSMSNSAPAPTSGQRQPAATSSTDKQSGGGPSGTSGVADSTEQDGSPAPGSGTTGSPVAETCAADCVGGTTLQGAGQATPTAPSSISFSSGVLSQPPSISIPLPTPPGVPAGGIFGQVATLSTGSNVSALFLDPVAVDLSTLSSAPVVSSGVAGKIHGGQPHIVATQSATNTLGFGFLKPSLFSSSDSTPRLIPIGTSAKPARQRAELPDVIALAAVAAPKNAASDTQEDADPKAPIDSVTERLKNPEDLVASEASSGAASRINPGDGGRGETKPKDQRIPANLAIYTAASLTVSVSAPGLTSVIRHDKRWAKRRLTIAPGGRARGRPR
jgi:hypothetical protein